MAALSFKFEVYTETAPRGVQSWQDRTTDVIVSDGVTWDRGIVGTSVLDRCASTGSLRCTVKNSAIGTLCNWNNPTMLGKGVRVTLGDGSTTAVVWTGYLRQIVPGIGPFHAGTRVSLVATDWFEDAAIYPISNVAAQVNKRGDEVITALTTSEAPQFGTPSLDAGDATFPYALDNIEAGQTRMLQALAQVAQSEHGYVYLKGDETLRFEKRTARAASAAVAHTFVNAVLGFAPIYTEQTKQTVTVRVTSHPREVDAAATTVLFKRYDIASGQTALAIAAGATVTVFGPYGDPNNANARCGGTSMQAPVSGTDYKANSAADGTGSNKTSSLTVTPSFTSAGVSVALANADSATIYVTLLQFKGKGIYDRTTVDVDRGGALPDVVIDMPFQSDANYAYAVADQVYTQWQAAYPFTVTFNAFTATRMASAVTGEIGQRVSLTETASGFDADGHIQHISQTLRSAKDLVTTWTCLPAFEGYWWVLGQTGASELDSTTRLYY